jgi:DNA-binding transcriptional LysR family regulator
LFVVYDYVFRLQGRPMELRHLRYFVAVAEEQHITRAAQRLGIQQPPLSQQIRDLERELGVQLFERTPRSIKLNAAGQVFLKDARRLLSDAQDAAMHVRRAARGESGRIAVGYTSSASLHPLVPRLVRSFQARYPQVDLEFQENATRDLLEAVAGDAVDAAFVRSSVDRYPGLRAVLLGKEPVVVALPVGHPLAGRRKALALAELADEAWILYRRADGPGIQDELMPAWRKAGITPRIAADVPRLLSAVTLVAAGRGMALVPQALSALHTESVVYRKLDASSAFTIPLNLVFRQDPPAPVSRFVAMAQAQLRRRPRA